MTNDDMARDARSVSSQAPGRGADYGRHELLDRSEMILSLVVDYLLEHQDIRADEKALANRAHDALFRLYQVVGGRHLRGDESPLAQSTGTKRAMSIMMDYAEAYDRISGDDLEAGGPDPKRFIARIVDALESGKPTQADVDALVGTSLVATEVLNSDGRICRDEAAKALRAALTPFQKG